MENSSYKPATNFPLESIFLIYLLRDIKYTHKDLTRFIWTMSIFLNLFSFFRLVLVISDLRTNEHALQFYYKCRSNFKKKSSSDLDDFYRFIWIRFRHAAEQDVVSMSLFWWDFLIHQILADETNQCQSFH